MYVHTYRGEVYRRPLPSLPRASFKKSNLFICSSSRGSRIILWSKVGSVPVTGIPSATGPPLRDSRLGIPRHRHLLFSSVSRRLLKHTAEEPPLSSNVVNSQDNRLFTATSIPRRSKAVCHKFLTTGSLRKRSDEEDGLR